MEMYFGRRQLSKSAQENGKAFLDRQLSTKVRRFQQKRLDQENEILEAADVNRNVMYIQLPEKNLTVDRAREIIFAEISYLSQNLEILKLARRLGQLETPETIEETTAQIATLRPALNPYTAEGAQAARTFLNRKAEEKEKYAQRTEVGKQTLLKQAEAIRRLSELMQSA